MPSLLREPSTHSRTYSFLPLEPMPLVASKVTPNWDRQVRVRQCTTHRKAAEQVNGAQNSRLQALLHLGSDLVLVPAALDSLACRLEHLAGY